MTKRASNSLLITCLLAMLLALPSCKKKAPAPPAPQTVQAQAPVAPVQKPVQKQQSSAQMETLKAPSLDFANKKDPFKSLIAPPTPAAKTAAPVATRSGSVLPIQAFDATKYRVSGIVIGLKENKALVIDPNGKGYVVKQGMMIGNNDGRITKITANAIEVSEQFRDESGHTKKRVIKLSLTPPQKK
jgi:type IV pilus assembly protein PilP